MITIEKFTKERIPDIIEFEQNLRKEEDFWFWDIDDKYISALANSFDDPRFANGISFIAYVDGKPVGRIDSSLIASHFDGSMKAYLDWICVIKSYRHLGVGQAMLEALRSELKKLGIEMLVALTAANDEAQRFYKSVPDSNMHDVGIWIDIK